MNCFVGYFHEPFLIGEIQYPDTILGLVFEYCFYNHDKLNGVEIDETSFKMPISSADFQEIASFLLGDSFEVTKDPRWILLSGRYDEAVDRYVTSFAKDNWGGDSFSIELETSIKHLFGFVQPEKYLEKFFSFKVSLDNGTITDKISEKYVEYLSCFDNEILLFDKSIEESFRVLLGNLDTRKQEQLINRAAIAHKLLFKDKSVK